MSGIIWSAVLLVTALAAAISASSIEMELSSKIIVKGDDVSIRCHVSDFGMAMILYWWKKQEAEPVAIGSNIFVNKVVEETGRYNVEMEQNHAGVTFVLKITGAQPEDSGYFGCSLATVEGSDIYRRLTVFAPVESVRLFSMPGNASSDEPSREYAGGDVVNFQEGNSYYFRCIANGSNPSPTVNFYSGTTDITHLFKRDDKHVVLGHIQGMKRVVHTTTLTSSKAVVASWQYSGRDLRCTASVEQTEPVNVYVTPEFKYRPKVMCPNEMLSPVNVDGAKLTCIVRANPGVNELVWSWQRVSGAVVTLREGQTKNHYSFTVEDGETADEKVVSLVMEKVYPQMFRSYSLLASSNLGYSNSSIILVRQSTEVVIDGATSLRVTSLLCLLFVLALCLSAV